MSYELKRTETIRHGAQRILRAQVEDAVVELTGSGSAVSDAAVHAARKRFKRARAVLRLLRAALRVTDFRRENLCFRDAGRLLTGLRDAAVLREALDKLAGVYTEEVPPDELERVRDLLGRRITDVRQYVVGQQNALARVSGSMHDALNRLDTLNVRGNDWRVIDKGLLRIYRAGRKQFATARHHPTDANLHEWRKKAKYLWHALELLQGSAPVVMSRLVEHAHQLGDLLGEDRDLAVLHSTLAGAIEAERLLAVIPMRRADLQRAAQSLGARVYAEKPDAFVGSIGQLFRRWRRQALAAH